MAKSGVGVRRGDDDSDLLIKAIKAGNIVECRRLLVKKEGEEEGDYVVYIHGKDTFDVSPMIYASFYGRVDIIELLLSKGANIHNKSINDMSPIIGASQCGCVDVVLLLLSKGANMHDRDYKGMSSIIWTSFYGHVDIVKLLLAKGANMHDKDNSGMSSIIWAAQRGYVGIVQLLLSKGANIHDTNNGGFNSLYYASNDQIRSALLKWPTTMGIIMLQELGIIFIIDSESVIDLNQYIY